MLPIHKRFYNQDAPRFSQEAKADILPVARWFGEEKFTYKRVLWSIIFPHILPYYVQDKLMAREITYQKSSEGGISHTLKELKKAIWPAFPI